MRDPEFAQQFLALRKARGLTQRAAASALNISVPTIQNWEQGRSTPWERNQEFFLGQLDTAPHVEKRSAHMVGIDKARVQGRRDYALGNYSNPFKRYDMRKSWIDGWREAKEKVVNPPSTPPTPKPQT